MKANDLRTLILEDNRQMFMILTTILTAFGFRRIQGASTNEEARELCHDCKFDLIIADQKLKETSGLETVRWLRDPSGPMPFIPIIMISSFSERARIMDAINAGVDEFLVKPVRPVDIGRRIDAVTFRRRPFIRAGDYFGPDRRRRADPYYCGPKRRTDDEVEGVGDVFEFD